MKQRILAIVLILIILLIPTGCWNSREINTMAIVEAIGIDQTESGEICVTFQILKPNTAKVPAGGKEGTNGEKGVFTVTSSGETIIEAFRNATKEAGQKLYVSYNKVIIICESIAKAGIGKYIEFLFRDPECRRLANVLISECPARDIIEADSEFETIPAMGIEHMVKSTSETSTIPQTTLHDIQKALSSKTAGFFAPGIMTKRKTSGEKETTVTKLNDTAIFKGDKLIGWCGEKETRGMLWILDEVESGIININSPQEETGVIALEIISSSSEIIPKIKDGKLFVTIKITESGNLDEQMSENLDLSKSENIKELKNRQSQEILKEVCAAIRLIQMNWGADVFGFGPAFHRKYPKQWKDLEMNWNEEVRNITIYVEVDTELVLLGLKR